jgi:histidine triad (HIT) family protein
MASNPDCIFCKIIAGEIPSKKAFENDEVFAFHDINPAAPTHILVVPKDHIANVGEINADTAPLMGRLMAVVGDLAREHKLDQAGYRVVSNTGDDGGQSVHHLHVHLLGGRKMTWPPG